MATFQTTYLSSSKDLCYVVHLLLLFIKPWMAEPFTKWVAQVYKRQKKYRTFL